MTFRILSLDGGGIRGVIAAVILAELEKEINQPLNKYFDLIAGTSTGSILAAGIATGIPSREMIRLYEQKGERIFRYTSRFSLKRLKVILQYGLSAPKHSNQGLIEVMKEQFGTTKLSDIYDSPRLLITAYDTISRMPIVFKSWREDKDYFDVPLWEACVCSASAPTYFPAHQLKTQSKTYSAIDGGVGANNPSSCALAEAIRLNHSLEEISIISIGTGASNRPIPWEKARGWGLGQWGWQGRLIEVLFDAPSDIHRYITKELMGSLESEDATVSRYLRLQPQITSDAMDDATRSNIAKLKRVAKNYAWQNQGLFQNFLKIN
ncbi:MAG: patatin-like phospholipase family protein [Moorea sp. SIO1F2]|uniref:CBASS cGAMP-activated phospholipase n=1 Tax=unclassified Moorena TaxID=2683338 RepID=UPI0013BCCFB9|nr:MULTISPECIES: CBASS cGAMP-activated phospholipase [unclassified Moorena]NEN95209.1 patatin-like phospholipase family protein [Moorena sp. SIO3I7]NEO04832.1 patatin-like phospholipase family protein [Moorena sp. SIO3I8]NET84614.1 patatin-like phospholipase family protein [Moorena sp. SIO1F2]